MITINEAYKIIDNVVEKTNLNLVSEKVRTIDALNRILIENQKSKLDLPPFNKSAMDGYVVLADDDYSNLKVIETVAAGQFAKSKLIKGTTIKVMTGAPVPNGTAKVIPIENTKCCNEVVSVVEIPKVSHICQQGEDICCGEVILPAFSKLDELAITNLISCGINVVNVWRKLRMAILVTGDEIVAENKEIIPGKIIDANGSMLKLLAEKHGFEISLQKQVSDQKDDLLKAFNEAKEAADIIVFTGGVSMGDFDYVEDILHSEGCNIHFNSVAIKPGKPITFASVENKVIFGLPGNPVSVYLLFHLMVLRLARLLQKRKVVQDKYLVLAQDYQRANTKREEFVPAKLMDGKLFPISINGSAHLLALLESDGFFSVPIGVDKIATDREVKYIATRSWD